MRIQLSQETAEILGKSELVIITEHGLAGSAGPA